METMETQGVSEVSEPLDPQTEARIIELARVRFFGQGYSRVTMDEIADGLGMSKKTLYRHFASKEDLLRATARQVIARVSAALNRVIDDGRARFEDRLRSALDFIGTQLSSLDPSVPLDFQRNAPEVWREIERFREQDVIAGLGRLMAEGQSRGVFRRDIPPDLMVRVFLTMVRHLVTPERLVEMRLTSWQAYDLLLSLTMEGLVSDRARAHLKRRRRSK
jgi:AcrR family transcriptional regulator